MNDFLMRINDVIWGIPLIVLLLGTGIYFTIKLRFLQIRKLKLAFLCIFKKQDGDGDVSSFQSLCTALSSTIGTGNIVGVATAIVAGGPGAVFWMWMSAFFGMTTKYAEGLLAIKYRTKDDSGKIAGGPMYYLELGLKNKFLAKAFAVFGMCAALFGIGTFTQTRSISDAIALSFHIPTYISAIILAVLVGFITLGGIQRIASVAEKIVPFMTLFYIAGVMFVIITHIKQLPDVFYLIISEALSIKSLLGGTLGVTIQKGISRGIFSNESGLGSAPIAAAASQSNSCVEQGLVSMTGTFIDTIVICTMSAVAILITSSHTSGLEGAAMTSLAFSTIDIIPHLGNYIVNIGLVFFAFTTIIGWNYYGERCAYYLKGQQFVKIFKYLYIIAIAVAPFISLSSVFIIADIMNGLMAIPNLIGLIGLRHVVINETHQYFNRTM